MRLTETRIEPAVRLGYLTVQQATATVSGIQKLDKQLRASRNALEARK